MFTHLDPDHIEGFRVVEQITIDFRTWKAFPEKQIHLVLPQRLLEQLRNVRTAYGSQLGYFEERGFIRCSAFNNKTIVGAVTVTAIPIHRGDQISFIYVFEKHERKLIYAPCDIKPFPENRTEVQCADLLLIQPGIFKDGLKDGYTYPDDHISRTTLYTIDETIALGERIRAKKILFIHLEEYWNRSYTDYSSIQDAYDNVQFAYDGMRVKIE
jgi:phosphoribosyl 1,2-cyclic phosphate phosphodiesterase